MEAILQKNCCTTNERIRRIESEVETIKANQKLENKLIEGKLNHTSREVLRMSQVLDEFQDNHLIIRRPDTTEKGSEWFT